MRRFEGAMFVAFIAVMLVWLGLMWLYDLGVG